MTDKSDTESYKGRYKMKSRLCKELEEWRTKSEPDSKGIVENLGG